MADVKKAPGMADLEVYALSVRGRFMEPIYIWGEPGVIRWSRREPEGPLRYVILSPRGRVWWIVRGDG